MKIKFRSQPDNNNETGQPDPNYQRVTLAVNGHDWLADWASNGRKRTLALVSGIAAAGATRARHFPDEALQMGAEPEKLIRELERISEAPWSAI